LANEFPDLEIQLTALGGSRVRLEFLSSSHPFDPEAHLLVDKVLVAVDAMLGGIATINDSPRDWWRTFRNLKE
jgi:hypothetical protein